MTNKISTMTMTQIVSDNFTVLSKKFPIIKNKEFNVTAIRDGSFDINHRIRVIVDYIKNINEYKLTFINWGSKETTRESYIFINKDNHYIINNSIECHWIIGTDVAYTDNGDIVPTGSSYYTLISYDTNGDIHVNYDRTSKNQLRKFHDDKDERYFLIRDRDGIDIIVDVVPNDDDYDTKIL